MAFDYYGIDPTSPVDTVPLSQLPAFIRDAKKAFTSTFISGVEFEAGTVFGDAVYYDKDSKKWRRSIWIKGANFNVDGFTVPQYQGVTTGALVHGSWMFEGGTELYLSSTEPGKIYPAGSGGIPPLEDGPFLIGRQITPGVILFMPGIGNIKSFADAAKGSAEEAKVSAAEAKASADTATALKAEIIQVASESESTIRGVADQAVQTINTAVAGGVSAITTVVEGGILTIQTAVDEVKVEINSFKDQTINFIKVVSEEQLVIIRNAGAVARRELEIEAEKIVSQFRSFMIVAQEAAGQAQGSASLALTAKNMAEIASISAQEAQQRMQSLKTDTVEGQIPNVGYIASSNTLLFTLARGAQGPQGAPAPAGEKGPQGDMGPIPSGAAFGKMLIDADGMLSFEFLDLAGVIGSDTFTIDENGYLIAKDA